MTKLTRVNQLTIDEIRTLISSTKTFLFDIDGVLLHNISPLPGAIETVNKLRSLNKKIGFVTNNTMYSVQNIQKNLEVFGCTTEEVIFPTLNLLHHLQNIGFKKDIYVICGNEAKKLLKNAGYKVLEYRDVHQGPITEHVSAIVDLFKEVQDTCSNVGVVYVDLDLNYEFGAIQVAKFILNHFDDVQLLTGLVDDLAPIGGSKKLICTGFISKALQRWTNKKELMMGKPGILLKDFVVEKFKLSSSNEVLVVGDNIETDIAFGTGAGFQTLLVLTGATKKDDLENWRASEDSKPDFWANNLAEFYEKIKNF